MPQTDTPDTIHVPQTERSLAQPQTYYLLLLLWLSSVMANIDRFSLSIVLQQIKADLVLTDTQVSLVTGASFLITYIGFGVVVGRWIDRGHRRNILAASVGFWSLMTIATTAATNFFQLALARAGLGAGEAGCVPAAMSMIGDAFPRDKRSQVIGLFHSALPMSGILGSPLVGWLADRHGWHAAFVTLGGLGLLLAALIRFTAPEPQRRRHDERTTSPSLAANPSLGASLGLLWQIRAYRYTLLAQIVFGIAAGGVVGWLSLAFLRIFPLTMTDVGWYIGTACGLTMFTASLLSGWGCARVARHRNDERYLVWLPATFCLLAVPALVLTFAPTNMPVAMASGAIFLGLSIARIPPLMALIMNLLPRDMHGLGTSVFNVIAQVGTAMGPLIVGIASDAMTPSMGSVEALRHALLYTLPPMAIAGALLAYLPARYIRPA